MCVPVFLPFMSGLAGDESREEMPTNPLVRKTECVVPWVGSCLPGRGVEVLPPGPRCGALLGNRVFADTVTFTGLHEGEP